MPSSFSNSTSSSILLQISLIIIIIINLPFIVKSDPLSHPFSSCLSQYSDSLAPTDQLINFTQLYTQIDVGQNSPGQLPTNPQSLSLRLSLFGNVPSQSLGYSSKTNYLATLITQSSVLNFQTYFNQSALCSSIRTPAFTTSSNTSSTKNDQTSNSSLAANSGCPYGPGDVALGVTIPLGSAYPLTSISSQLHILDTSTPALTLACVQFDVTPYYPEQIYYKLLLWIPIALTLTYLIICWSGRIWAAKVSEQLDREAQVASSISDPYTTNNEPMTTRIAAIWWNAWSGQGLLVSGTLLRFSTPCTRDIIWHTQFAASLGFFAVQWPDFVYPIVIQGAWSTLIFNTTFSNSHNNSSTTDPLSTPTFNPPGPFTNQINDISSPIYLNRSLSNDLLNIRQDLPGISRWAKMIGLQPEQVFISSAIFFASICGVGIIWSILVLLIDIFGSFSSNLFHRLQPISNDDGVGYHRSNGPPPSKEDESSPVAQAPWWQKTSGINYFRESDNENKSKKRRSRQVRNSASSGSSSNSCGQRFSGIKSPVWHLHWCSLQGNLTRIILLCYFPIVTFSAYHISLYRTASTSSVGVAGVILFLSVALPILQFYRITKRTPEELLDDLNTILTLGPLYNTFADRNELFMAVRLSSALVVGVTIGASQSCAIAHAVILLVAEMTETMLTSLWLPWGDGAAMAPLAFVFSVSRIITAVILVVLTPTVSLGPIAAGWLAYVILLLQGIVFFLSICVVLFKIAELFLRTFAHIPFDETRSTRYGGLKGAIRRWDRNGNRSTRHGRAAEIAARRRKRAKVGKNGIGGNVGNLRSSLPPRSSTIFLDPNNNNQHNQPGSSQSASALSSTRPAVRHDYRPGTAHSNGFVGLNDEDGNIMSAMSQGPWLRTQPQPPHVGYLTPGLYSNPKSGIQDFQNTPEPSAPSPSTGFAVVRGGRATEKMPYQVHNDGRRTHPTEYPPIAHQATSRKPFGPSSGGVYELERRKSARTTTNLFDNNTFASSPTPSQPRKKKKKTRLWGRKSQESSSEEDESEDESEDDEDQDQRPIRRGWIEGIKQTISNWGGNGEKVEELDPIQPTTTTTFEVVRQPRPRPSRANSTNLIHNNSNSLDAQPSSGLPPGAASPKVL